MLDKVLMTLFCQTHSTICPWCYKKDIFLRTEEVESEGVCYECGKCGCIVELNSLFTVGYDIRKGRVLREGKK